MRILLCHCYYQRRGGEDCVFEEERDLLHAAGHEVIEYCRKNEELTKESSLSIAGKTLWNRETARKVRSLLKQHLPDVFHATNTFPLISPTVLRVAHKQGVAVVQALQNYRLICPGSYLMRDGRPCHDCLGKAVPWPAIQHRCYRDSVTASAAVVSMVALHRLMGTWRSHVDLFMTPTEFSRQRLIEGGLPADKVVVKYNTVTPVPPVGAGDGNHVVFVGRLSPEKGLSTLLDAWKLDTQLPPIKIIGDGPRAAQVQEACKQDTRIEWLGHLELSELHPLVGSAKALIMPSVWYETFGRTTVEAFASGTPVIGSNLGAMQELIEEGCTGFLFEPGNADALRKRLHHFLELPPQTQQEMRAAARQRFESSFTEEDNLRRLLEIYEQARTIAATRHNQLPKEKTALEPALPEKASPVA